MSAGKRRHRVTIQHRPQQGDDYDAISDKWETFLEAWAQITPLRGEALEEARHIAEHVDHRLRFRWCSAADEIKRHMRIVYGDRVFNIRHAMNLNERNREVEVYCVEDRTRSDDDG